MVKTIWFFPFLLLSTICVGQTVDPTHILFDDGWKFFKVGVERGQTASFNDAHWRTLDLPHDWSIEDIGATQSPFYSNAVSQVQGGFTSGGTSW
ncbi:MAG: hypothetical protein Q8918_02685 [Bacteroidota bacterium]|nr:hypothetical protein [Bacteroidota bacterium]MDP4213971.1 hypothetical protein [Bacteroidota bacterium]MDP4248996.1 hypothetical protein [Bacteroidota bacterium]